MRLGVAAWVLLFGPVLSLLSQEPQIPPEILHYADVVLYNGKILTADDSFTIAQAVAIRDGKFLSVGYTSGEMPVPPGGSFGKVKVTVKAR